MTAFITSNPGSGGYEFAVDQVGNIVWPKSKIAFGADGVTTDVTPATGFPVMNGGTTGADYSANPSAYPPTSPLVLLSTVPVNPVRNRVAVQNQDVPELQVWRVNNTSAPTVKTLIVLDGAAVTGQQGGEFDSNTFKGGLLIYGMPGQQISVYED